MISERVMAVRSAVGAIRQCAHFFNLVKGLFQQAGIFNGDTGLGSQCCQQTLIGFRKRPGLFTFRADHANGALPHLHGYVQPGSDVLEGADRTRVRINICRSGSPGHVG